MTPTRRTPTPRLSRTVARRVATATAVGGLWLLGAAPAHAEPPTPTGDITLNTTPSPPTVTMTTPQVVEGTGGQNDLVFLLELDKPAAGGESLRFYTQDGQGSALPVEDHEPVLLFPELEAGQTELEVAVPLVTDDVPEANEHILVTIDQPDGLTIPDGAGTGIIQDDDIPTVSVDDVTLPEGSGGPTGYHFTVSLSEPSTVDVYVSATPTAGSAGEGTDWQALPQLVQFAPGETSHELVVSVIGDVTPEADETFTVELSDADYAAIDDGSGLGTILDDDAAGSRRRPGDLSAESPAGPVATGDDPATTTTTAGTASERAAALDATLAASKEEAPAAPPVVAVAALLALAVVGTGGAWRLRRR